MAYTIVHLFEVGRMKPLKARDYSANGTKS
jgi:hypothetical protein